MSILVTTASVNVGGALHRRAVALANIRWFRALAQRAVRDGGPQAKLRAADARAAACIILRQAKREAVVGRMAREAVSGDL